MCQNIALLRRPIRTSRWESDLTRDVRIARLYGIIKKLCHHGEH